MIYRVFIKLFSGPGISKSTGNFKIGRTFFIQVLTIDSVDNIDVIYVLKLKVVRFFLIFKFSSKYLYV